MNSIYLNPHVVIRPSFSTTPIHEFQHGATEANKYLTPFAQRMLHGNVNPEMGSTLQNKNLGIHYKYYNDPTEVHARTTALKYLLDKHGIADPKKNKITEEDLEKAFKVKAIQEDGNVRDLIRMFQGKGDLLRVLNEVAMQEGQDPIQGMAVMGGYLKRGGYSNPSPYHMDYAETKPKRQRQRKPSKLKAYSMQNKSKSKKKLPDLTGMKKDSRKLREYIKEKNIDEAIIDGKVYQFDSQGRIKL